jgi:hypothetical protein
MPGTSSLQTLPAGQFSSSAVGTPVVTDITPTTARSWSLAPNPAGADGTRLFGPEGAVTIAIHDATGKLISTASKVLAAQTPADLSDILPTTPGIYTVLAQSVAGQYRTRLVIE